MKFNFKWGKNNKQEMTPELTERKVNVYKHENPIKGAEHLGQRKCVECGKWFTPEHHNQTICSDECREKRDKRQKSEWSKKNYQEQKAKKAMPKDDTVYYEDVINEKLSKLEHGSEEWCALENELLEKQGTSDRVCLECGKLYTPDYKLQVTCSEECREKRRHKQKNEWQRKAYVAAREIKKTEQTEEYKQAVAVPTRTCIICGKVFTPKSVNHRVCSDECRKEQMRRVTNKWHAEHREETRRRQHEYYESRKALKTNKHLEVAVVVRKLIEAGVEDEIVAKYLQTSYGDK